MSHYLKQPLYYLPLLLVSFISCREETPVSQEAATSKGRIISTDHSLYEDNDTYGQFSTIFEDGKLLHPSSISIFHEADELVKAAIKNYRIAIHDPETSEQPAKRASFSFEIILPEGIHDGPSSTNSIEVLIHLAILCSHISLEKKSKELYASTEYEKLAKQAFLKRLQKELVFQFKRDDVAVRETLSGFSEKKAVYAEYMNYSDI